MKKFVPYAIALAIGLAIWTLLTPALFKMRGNANVGGEMFIPIALTAATAIVLNKHEQD